MYQRIFFFFFAIALLFLQHLFYKWTFWGRVTAWGAGHASGQRRLGQWLSTRIGKHINLHVHWHAKTCVVTALNTKRLQTGGAHKGREISQSVWVKSRHDIVTQWTFYKPQRAQRKHLERRRPLEPSLNVCVVVFFYTQSKPVRCCCFFNRNRSTLATDAKTAFGCIFYLVSSWTLATTF